MRYAIVSDLHANSRAWSAVLADLCEQGADVVVCLGDVVGYGPNPSEVLQSVRSVTNNFVMGNHDAAAVGMMDYSIFNNHARQAIEWTMTALNDEEKQFLASVPLAIEAGEILFVHAEISEPGRFAYISDTEVARENFEANNHLVTFVGHTHLPKIFERNQQGHVRELADDNARLDANKRYIVNVGSVGEPRDARDLRARYVLYDPETREVIFRRVEFDIVAYRNDLKTTTLALRPFFLRIYEQVVEGRDISVSNGGSLVDMKVSNDSAALVDLGQVAQVANLRKSGAPHQSARPSRLPMVLLATAAILVLGFVGFWISPGRNSPTKPPMTKKEDKTKKEKKTTPPIPPGVKPTPPKRKPKPMMVAKIPDKPKPKPKPSPLKPEPEPEPESVPATKSGAVEVAWWRMGDDSENNALIDQKNKITLAPVKEGKTIKALAPDPIPGNGTDNSAAKQLGIWEEEKPNGHFALTDSHSFTFEGWFFIGTFRKPVFLFGTRSNLEDSRGWHLDIRPRSRGQRGESISFFYDSGKNQTQAIASNLRLANAAAHHFAIVWDHDASEQAGQMNLYLDGKKVANAALPHDQLIGEQVSPLRVGASFNPPKVGLDELLFTRRSLEPHEFLIREKVTGITLVKSNKRSTDSWAEPGNWAGGEVPEGSDNVIISPGLNVQIKSAKPEQFTGKLVLKKGASLQLWTKESETILPKPGKQARLIMFANSRLVLRAKEESMLGPIEIVESANIFGGISTSGHHAIRSFASEISGPGQLIVNGVNGNAFRFEYANTFSGGTISKNTASQTFHLVGVSDGCFGTGDVEVRDFASLRIRKGTKDKIADSATLTLSGPKGNLDQKLMMEANETVGRLVIDGVDQGEGVFTKKTHPGTIGGDGKLTVKNVD